MNNTAMLDTLIDGCIEEYMESEWKINGRIDILTPIHYAQSSRREYYERLQ